MAFNHCGGKKKKHTHTIHWRSGSNQSFGSSALVVNEWLWPGNKTFLKVASMVVTWFIVAFFAQCNLILREVKCVFNFLFPRFNLFLVSFYLFRSFYFVFFLNVCLFFLRLWAKRWTHVTVGLHPCKIVHLVVLYQNKSWNFGVLFCIKMETASSTNCRCLFE